MKDCSQRELFDLLRHNTENFPQTFEITHRVNMDWRCIDMEWNQFNRISQEKKIICMSR